MKENKYSLKISRSFFGDTTLDGYPIATYSNDELKILKNLLTRVLGEVNEYIKDYRRMKELKVGERITVTLEVVEQGGGCKDCFFGRDRCFVPSGPRCSHRNRSDKKRYNF